MSDILHDSVQCSAEKLGVFIVHGNDNKQLGLPRRIANVLSQSKARFREVIGTGRDGGISGL